VHHPHKLRLREPDQELKLQHQLCRNGWRHDHSTTIPRHKTHTFTHTDAHARKSNPPGDAGENLELAPVLATSKLLGVVKNNEETRQKRLTHQKRLTKATPVSNQQQLLLVRKRRIPRADSQSEGGAK
jgi:hypothetical protein